MSLKIATLKMWSEKKKKNVKWTLIVFYLHPIYAKYMLELVATKVTDEVCSQTVRGQRAGLMALRPRVRLRLQPQPRGLRPRLPQAGHPGPLRLQHRTLLGDFFLVVGFILLSSLGSNRLSWGCHCLLLHVSLRCVLGRQSQGGKPPPCFCASWE